MTTPEVGRLLDRFAAEIGQLLPLVGLWAHGSLALGDFVPGRSDLDLVALIDAPATSAQRLALQSGHEALIRDEPLAAGLHCTYLVRAEVDDPSRNHLTWAHQELYERPVSPISRRELRQGGRCLLGVGPAAVIPPVTDAELADYVRTNLLTYWYPLTDRPDLWQQDVWVDQGVVTLGRAVVTLREGRLVTKKEALDVLVSLGAPADVIADIRERRYGTPPVLAADWRVRRGELARAFLRLGIERALGI